MHWNLYKLFVRFKALITIFYKEGRNKIKYLHFYGAKSQLLIYFFI